MRRGPTMSSEHLKILGTVGGDDGALWPFGWLTVERSASSALQP